MKTCITCRRSLGVECFGVNKSYRDRLSGKCRECTAAYCRVWAAAHQDELRAKRRADYQANREERLAACRLRTADERRPGRARHYAKHRDKIIAKAIDTMHRRRAGGGHVSAAEWRAIQDEHDNRCVYCGNPSSYRKLTRDHVVPLSRGGTHEASNIRPACQRCNTSKGQKLLLEWSRTRFPVAMFPYTPGVF